MLRVALPIRAQAHRFGFVLLLATAFALMVFSRTEMFMIERLRADISDIFVPVMSVLSHPAQSVRKAATEVGHFVALHEQNIQLQETNSRLQRWQAVAHKLERENAGLRALMSYRPEPLASYISARVVGGSAGVFVRTLMLNAGAHDGVRKGRAVLDGNGMVGRVVEVGQRSARVLLLTDLNSRIPVVLGVDGYRAILAGDNSDTMHLELLSPKARIDVGMRVTTSGHGGQLPSGLPIGRVSSLQGGEMQVQSFVDFDRLEYVMVIDWQVREFTPVLPVGSDGTENTLTEGEQLGSALSDSTQ